jgi:hypothetical protein
MIGRRAVIGLSLLSALLFCAFAAQSVFAAEGKNTTAFTCAPGSGAGFSDSHCDTAVGSGGSFVHTAIKGETKEIEGSNEKVTEGTKKSEPAVLKGEVALTKTEVLCTKVKNNLEKSFLINGEPLPKEHRILGEVVTEFTGCTVLKPENKCIVKEPIVSSAVFEGVEGLTGPNKEEKGMGLLFIGAGVLNELFATIEFKSKEKEVCPIAATFEITGTVTATSGPVEKSKQTNKHSGSTLVFEKRNAEASNMQNLKLGPNNAEFTGVFTASMAKGNALTLTTVT